MLIAAGELIGGLIVLTIGGHYLVEGAIRIALLARISTAVVGLTIVAMGTSMPEMAVSVGAAVRGAPDISYSNIVGSNIFNVGAILGLTALLRPIAVTGQTIRLEYPFMVIASWIVLLLSRDGVIDRLEGAFLIASVVAFTVYMVRLARRDVTPEEAAELDRAVNRLAGKAGGLGKAWGKYALIVIGGIVALAIGAQAMVLGAITVAERYGITQRVIGLTIVAMGTSLPELTTSVIAARRGESGIALGNVIGSNIFNVLAILGITSMIVPVHVSQGAINIDNWVMLAFSVVLFPMMLWGRRVTRRDGLVLLAGFGAYMIALVVGGG